MICIAAGTSTSMTGSTQGKRGMNRVAAGCIRMNRAVRLAGAVGCAVTAAATNVCCCRVGLGVTNTAIWRRRRGTGGRILSGRVAVCMATDAAGTTSVTRGCCIERHEMATRLETVSMHVALGTIAICMVKIT